MEQIKARVQKEAGISRPSLSERRSRQHTILHIIDYCIAHLYCLFAIRTLTFRCFFRHIGRASTPPKAICQQPAREGREHGRRRTNGGGRATAIRSIGDERWSFYAGGRKEGVKVLAHQKTQNLILWATFHFMGGGRKQLFLFEAS